MVASKPMRFFNLIGPVVLVGVVAACGGSSSTQPTTPTNTSANNADDEAALTAQLTEHHAHHHGGFTHLVIMSVESLGGTPEQHDKVEAVRKDLVAKTAPVHEANKALIAVLADVVADGVATPEEQTKVDGAVTQLATAASAAHAASVQALNQLHGILDASQRQALVDKVEAQWQVWRQANAEDDKDNNGLPDAEERRLTHMTKLLGLSQDQVDKIKGSLKTGMASLPNRLDAAEVDAHVKAFGDAFIKDSFDAGALHGENVNAHLAGAGATRMAKFYTLMAPTLTPDQRTKLADHFRKHQNKGPELPSDT
jgi:Spy/CpxP family protein refolding chaperone